MATSTDLRVAIEEIRQAMGPEDVKPDLDEALRRARESWTKKFEERIGSLPWWLLSTMTHGALLLLLGSMVLLSPPPKEEETVIIVHPSEARPVVEFRRVTRPAFAREEQLLKTLDSDYYRPEPKKLVKPGPACLDIELPDDEPLGGDPAAMGEIPVGETGVFSSIGPTPALPAGSWDYIRRKARARLCRRGGGGSEALSAVDLALDWLARHQEADGHWNSRKHDVSSKSRPAHTTDRADTALALLAFLGSGHTPTHGKYKDNVRRAIIWLMHQQRADGAFFKKAGGHRESAGYQHAICGLALAEAYGMTRNRLVGAAAQRAVNYSTRRHQSRYSGWRYDPRGGADLSVTGWFVMQLKSAQMVGLRVDGSGLQGAGQFLDKVTDERGRCGYTSKRAVNPTMTSVGMLCRQFMGMSNQHAAVKGAAAYLAQHPPHGGDRANPKTFYYWYYGTLAMFQYGGEEWRAWNAAMKRNLLSTQRTDGDARGSWDPVGKYDKIAGRVYTTAMGALTLEVYYRYLQMYPR
jgi:hypothetical protein